MISAKYGYPTVRSSEDFMSQSLKMQYFHGGFFEGYTFFPFKAKLLLNHAELREECKRQFCRAHSGLSESYMVYGYWS
jgi:hypothetical protein